MTSNNFQIPEDFPIEEAGKVLRYDSPIVFAGRQSPDSENYYLSPLYEEYDLSESAILLRFKSCAEYDEEFRASLSRCNTITSQQERYIQDRAVYGFFTSGHSCIESFCYLAYMLGGMVKPEFFDIESTGDLSKVTPHQTLKLFKLAFQRDDLTKAMHTVLKSNEYEDWGRIRNILAHRGTPKRVQRLNPKGSSNLKWHSINLQLNIDFDANLTYGRRRWLAESLKTLYSAHSTFTDRYEAEAVLNPDNE